MTPWYEISNASSIASPTVLLYPDRIQHNLQRMIELTGDVNRLRPHVKTHKLAPIIAMKRAAGIHKFKVSTIAEAEMTAQAQGEDILLAHQPNGPGIARFIALMQRFPATRWATLVDDVGMNRTGIIPDEAALALYRQLCRTPAVTAGGLHAYDGHLHNPDNTVLSRKVEDTFAVVWAMRDQLRAEGLPVPKLIASGTPTFALMAQHPDVEVGAGTTVLWDFGQEKVCPEHHMQNAAVLMTRIISKPAPDLLCLDLGHKAVAAEMPHPRVQLFGLEDAVATIQSEEHLVIQTPRAKDYHVGDVLYGLPRHICPTMALHSEVWAVREGEAAELWPVTARTRRITI